MTTRRDHDREMTRRELLGGAAALGAGVAAAVAGPAGPARAQTPKKGGTLTFRGWDPPLFDPMLTTAYRVQIPLSFTYSRLLKHRAGPTVTPEPSLAESWAQPNETTYVFKLRRGVRWHPRPPVKNQSHVDDPVVTDLLVRQQRTADRAKRRDLLHELQRHLARQQYYLQLPSQVNISAWDDALKGYAPNLGYDYGGRLMAAWLER